MAEEKDRIRERGTRIEGKESLKAEETNQERGAKNDKTKLQVARCRFKLPNYVS
jgi:hypothetical protein